MSFQFFYRCLKCSDKYTEMGWCKTCQIKDLKENFRNWSSGNKEIDDFIQDIWANLTPFDFVTDNH